ncbi:MAG: hypothetical protein U0744_06670 [Gemmataceae bacterium]
MSKALAKDPKDRYATIAAMADDVAALRTPTATMPGMAATVRNAELAPRLASDTPTREAAPTTLLPGPGSERVREMLLASIIAVAVAAGWGMLFQGGDWQSVASAALLESSVPAASLQPKHGGGRLARNRGDAASA